MTRAERPPPEAPEHLDQQARAKWAEIIGTLQARGDTLDTGTLDAAGAYCQAWSRWTAAEAQVATLGAVVKSAAGFAIVSPYVAVAAAAQRQMRQWGDVLGIHKPARRRKAAEPDEDQGGLLRLLGAPAKAPAKRAAS